jgi:putative acetyltransferase
MITYYCGEHKALADLFTRSVHELARQEYSTEQLYAWAPEPVDYLYWKYRCELKRPFLYKVGKSVAGFIELDPDGHIDCHYVHPDFTRQGIGSALLLHVIDIAQHLSLPRLYVEASHLIKPLYLKQGFICLRTNQVIRNGVQLENWIMEKILASE